MFPVITSAGDVIIQQGARSHSLHHHLNPLTPMHRNINIGIHMGTAIKHPVPDRVKLSFVIYKFLTSGHSDAQP